MQAVRFIDRPIEATIRAISSGLLGYLIVDTVSQIACQVLDSYTKQLSPSCNYMANVIHMPLEKVLRPLARYLFEIEKKHIKIVKFFNERELFLEKLSKFIVTNLLKAYENTNTLDKPKKLKLPKGSSNKSLAF